MARKRQIIISSIILVLALFMGLAIGAVAWIIKDTPDISNYKGASEATILYSADGQLLTKLYKQNRINVALDRIPLDLQNAVVAVEDTNFYVHHGVDFWGIARVLFRNITHPGTRPHGASTITQQLAGNALLNRQNISYYRKIQEAYLALQFERQFTKPEILEMYLNEIYFGHSSYGVEAAAQKYFGKNVWELDLAQCALIAGVLRGPGYYSPYIDMEAAVQRRNTVLNRMAEVGYITEAQAEKAKEEKIVLPEKNSTEKDFAPYYIRYVRDQLLDKFGAQLVYGGGLKVYTTLDPVMQKKAESAVDKAIEDKYIPTIKREDVSDKLQPQMALITIDPKTGEIRAMIGGRGNDQFNRATQAARQPGSAFKPFVYTTAIKQGWSPSSIVNDMPMLAKKEKDKPQTIWPTNYENEYLGLVSLRTGLIHSINVAAVKLLQKVGLNNTIETAESMGITTLQPADKEKDHLSLALGGLNKGVKPIEMASAYGIFANQGIYVEPIAITKVLDKHDRVIYNAHPEKKIVLPEDVAYLMTDMLHSVTVLGTGWRARLGKQTVAGKTGTTNGYTDAWFVGFTPDLVTSVWIGEDNVTTMEYNQKDENGNYLFPEGNSGRTISSAEAAQIWGNYMRDVVKDMPISNFKKPENIVTVEIDPITGLLPNKFTVNTKKEIFRKENVPTEVSTLEEEIATARIDKESGQLAVSDCPEENILETRYYVDNKLEIGKKSIPFGTKFEKKPEADPANPDANKDWEATTDIKGVYVVDDYEPIQKIDPVTGVPLTDGNGEIVYEKIPTEKCELHSTESDNLINSIWDFFNRFNK